MNGDRRRRQHGYAAGPANRTRQWFQEKIQNLHPPTSILQGDPGKQNLQHIVRGTRIFSERFGKGEVEISEKIKFPCINMRHMAESFDLKSGCDDDALSDPSANHQALFGSQRSPDPCSRYDDMITAPPLVQASGNSVSLSRRSPFHPKNPPVLYHGRSGNFTPWSGQQLTKKKPGYPGWQWLIRTVKQHIPL
jgi:hypothetical protein